MCVFGAKRGKRLGEVSPFSPFLSLIHILPICFDSVQVLYISLTSSTLREDLEVDRKAMRVDRKVGMGQALEVDREVRMGQALGENRKGDTLPQLRKKNTLLQRMCLYLMLMELNILFP